MAASFLCSGVLARKLGTCRRSRRRPAEPIWGLPRRYGGVSRKRYPGPPPAAGHPYLGMPSQIRRWGHETHIPPAYPECMSSGPARTIRAAFEAGVTQPPAPRPHWLRRGRLDFVAIADAVIAAVSFGLTNSALGALNAQHGHPHSVQELLLVSFLLCAPLLLRNRSCCPRGRRRRSP